MGFYQCHQAFVNWMKEKELDDNTIKRHKKMLRNIKRFEDHTKYPVNFETIDIKFYTKFLYYMRNHFVQRNGKL